MHTPQAGPAGKDVVRRGGKPQRRLGQDIQWTKTRKSRCTGEGKNVPSGKSKEGMRIVPRKKNLREGQRQLKWKRFVGKGAWTEREVGYMG